MKKHVMKKRTKFHLKGKDELTMLRRKKEKFGEGNNYILSVKVPLGSQSEV